MAKTPITRLLRIGWARSARGRRRRPPRRRPTRRARDARRQRGLLPGRAPLPHLVSLTTRPGGIVWAALGRSVHTDSQKASIEAVSIDMRWLREGDPRRDRGAARVLRRLRCTGVGLQRPSTGSAAPTTQGPRKPNRPPARQAERGGQSASTRGSRGSPNREAQTPRPPRPARSANTVGVLAAIELGLRNGASKASTQQAPPALPPRLRRATGRSNYSVAQALGACMLPSNYLVGPYSWNKEPK